VQECYSPTDIDFEPNEINDHFADSVSSGDVLDNSDIPSGHLGDGEFTFDEVGILRVFLVMPVVSMEYP
jgi:hypothetical protein